MKRVRLALGVVAVLSLFSSALTARSTPRPMRSISMTKAISSSCARYCRDVCAANGEPCCILDYNTCGCC